MNFKINDEDPDRLIKHRAKRRDQAANSFEEWLETPAAKLVISLLPPTDTTPGLLEQLLLSCYTAGFNTGGATCALEMLENMLKAREPKA